MSVDVVPAAPAAVFEDDRECFAPEFGTGRLLEMLPGGMVSFQPSGHYAPVTTTGVVLPKAGDLVELPRNGDGLVRGYWLGLISPQRGAERVRVRLLAAGEVVEHQVDWAAVAADRAVTAAGEQSPMADAVRVLAGMCGMYDRAIDDHEQWKLALSEAAHSYADDQDWCTQFDAFMVRWGLPARPPREYTYSVEVEVTGKVTVDVTATSEDEAARLVEREEVFANLDISAMDWTTGEVWEAD